MVKLIISNLRYTNFLICISKYNYNIFYFYYIRRFYISLLASFIQSSNICSISALSWFLSQRSVFIFLFVYILLYTCLFVFLFQVLILIVWLFLLISIYINVLYYLIIVLNILFFSYYITSLLLMSDCSLLIYIDLSWEEWWQFLIFFVILLVLDFTLFYIFNLFIL